VDPGAPVAVALQHLAPRVARDGRALAGRRRLLRRGLARARRLDEAAPLPLRREAVVEHPVEDAVEVAVRDDVGEQAFSRSSFAIRASSIRSRHCHSALATDVIRAAARGAAVMDATTSGTAGWAWRAGLPSRPGSADGREPHHR